MCVVYQGSYESCLTLYDVFLWRKTNFIDYNKVFEAVIMICEHDNPHSAGNR